jgi:hypothetical protein
VQCPGTGFPTGDCSIPSNDLLAELQWRIAEEIAQRLAGH